MKKMKRVLLFVGSCVSAAVENQSSDNSAMEIHSLSSPKQQILPFQKTGSKEEVFFDSKAWLESDDEEFMSVNGDYSPARDYKQIKNNEEDYEQKNNGEEDAGSGKKLSDLLHNSSSSDNQASVKANGDEAMSKDEEKKTTPKSTGKRFLPRLVRTLSCGGHKKKKKRQSSPLTPISAAA